MTEKCHTKLFLLPDKFHEKVTEFGGVCINIKKVVNACSHEISGGTSAAPPPGRPGEIRLSIQLSYIYKIDGIR